MEAVAFVFYAVSVLYALLIAYYAWGWLRLRPCPPPSQSPVTGISVVVAARNEAENLADCLRSLGRQNYPLSLFEVIVSDDLSGDATADVFRDTVHSEGFGNCRLLQAVPGVDRGGKKRALERAIDQAAFELIAVTDADGRAGRDWLQSIAACYENSRPVMMAGPVSLTGRGFLEKLQALEYAGLTATAAGAIGNGSPILCSGANMAFERAAFVAAGGYRGNEQYPSGDDVFLLNKLRQIRDRSIAFLKTPAAIVCSPAVSGVGKLAAQRIRWASKIRGFSGLHVLLSASLVYFANLSLLLSVILTFLDRDFSRVLIVQAVLKTSIDFLLLYLILSFYGKRRLLPLLIPGELLNAVHVVFAGAAALPGRYVWKGRQH